MSQTDNNVVRFTKHRGCSNPIELILGALDRPRKAGRGWTAKCPAHEDRTASLSVGEGHDGRVLLHCFAGCDAGAIVAALGFSLADLYPGKPDIADMTREQRSEMREGSRQAQWRAALGVLSFEATIVRIVAAAVKRGEVPPDCDMERLDQAAERIESARAVLNAR